MIKPFAIIAEFQKELPDKIRVDIWVTLCCYYVNDNRDHKVDLNPLVGPAAFDVRTPTRSDTKTSKRWCEFTVALFQIRTGCNPIVLYKAIRDTKWVTIWTPWGQQK